MDIKDKIDNVLKEGKPDNEKTFKANFGNFYVMFPSLQAFNNFKVDFQKAIDNNHGVGKSNKKVDTDRVLKTESIDLNEASITTRLLNDVEKQKKALKKKWASKGAYENFGQKEVRKLEDKYEDSSDYSAQMKEVRSAIRAFDDWCQNYDGE